MNTRVVKKIYEKKRRRTRKVLYCVIHETIYLRIVHIKQNETLVLNAPERNNCRSCNILLRRVHEPRGEPSGAGDIEQAGGRRNFRATAADTRYSRHSQKTSKAIVALTNTNTLQRGFIIFTFHRSHVTYLVLKSGTQLNCDVSNLAEFYNREGATCLLITFLFLFFRFFFRPMDAIQ